MAIAHVCVQCGRDLARVRPQREPHYGLNLLRCPTCGAASVRRVHPVQGGWRRFRRLDFVATMIFLRLVGISTLTLFCALSSIFTIALASELRLGGNERLPREAVIFAVMLFIIVPTLLGAFLTAAFAHIPRWKMWLGWLAWMGLILFMIALHGPLDSQFDPRPNPNRSVAILPWLADGCWYIVLPGLLATLAILVAATPGIVLGRLLLRLRDMLIRSKWRWRRKRLRLAGAANV